jgi:hypothetical protein
VRIIIVIFKTFNSQCSESDPGLWKREAINTSVVCFGPLEEEVGDHFTERAFFRLGSYLQKGNIVHSEKVELWIARSMEASSAEINIIAVFTQFHLRRLRTKNILLNQLGSVLE